MSKYDFILYAGQSADFIDKLRGLGLVDITTTGWEPSEEDRQLILSIEGHGKAVDFLSTFKSGERYSASAQPFATGEEAYEHCTAAMQKSVVLQSEIARLTKMADELRPWGEFSTESIKSLAEKGIVLRYFTTTTSNYAKHIAQWGELYTIELVNEVGTSIYFVAIAAPNAVIAIDAQEVKAPTMDYVKVERQILTAKEQLAELDAEFSHCASSLEMICNEEGALREKLQGVKVVSTAQPEADGTLFVMEGWAEKETSESVDALLEEYPNIVYIKSDPTPEDETPVKLKNNRFAKLFELIGAMYAMPKYGTIDLTPFFAPFYMLFFAICLCDAGYGAMLFAGGLALLLKGGESTKRAAKLTMFCGGSTMAFGFYANSFFGLSISSWSLFSGIKFLDFQSSFFTIALAIGVVQILFGMLINIWVTARTFGFRYSLGHLGWFIILIAACLAIGLQMLNPEWVIPSFTSSSPAFYAAAGVGGILMLFMNSPGKNLFINFGTGLWNTYNNVTGILGDVLSYIRLFAIGLSGGVLALVFNKLALGLTGLDGDLSATPWWAMVFMIIGATVILVIGHGINLFMSSISSFVHPMRLTFVEFYKNAGFEMTSRSFEPLRKMSKQD